MIKELLSYREVSYVKPMAIIALWLTHMAGMFGYTLGYEHWFITKTPLNLLLITIITFLVFPLKSSRDLRLFGLITLIGLMVELIGVNTSTLFGQYEYQDNLGYKIGGVPLLIGINWAILTIITGRIARFLADYNSLRIIAGALLMLFLDLFMEPVASPLGFWSFTDGMPGMYNYFCWFIVAIVLQNIYLRMDCKGDLKFSSHLYVAQLIFFIYLNAYFQNFF